MARLDVNGVLTSTPAGTELFYSFPQNQRKYHGLLAAGTAMGFTVNVMTENSPAAKEGSDFHPAGGGINDMLIFHTKGDAVPGRWPRGFKKKFKEGSLPSQFSQLELNSTGKNPFSKHSANNVDLNRLKDLVNKIPCLGCDGPPLAP